MAEVVQEEHDGDPANGTEQICDANVCLRSEACSVPSWFPKYEHPAEGDLRLEQYLKDHYEVIGAENGFDILQRRESKLVN